MRHPSGVTGNLTRVLGVAVIAAFAAFFATQAEAQIIEEPDPVFGTSSHPGFDVVTLNLHAGGFFSASSFAEGARFEDTGAFGASATFWAHENIGVRASGLWYSPAVQPGDQEIALFGEDPDIFHYSGDVVLRMPMAARADMSWFPYLLGGVGGKTYDFVTLGTATDLAGTVGAGLEVRFGQDGRWGLQTEVRDFISNFERAGVDQTLHDVIWTGGITFSF